MLQSQIMTNGAGHMVFGLAAAARAEPIAAEMNPLRAAQVAHEKMMLEEAAKKRRSFMDKEDYLNITKFFSDAKNRKTGGPIIQVAFSMDPKRVAELLPGTGFRYGGEFSIKDKKNGEKHQVKIY
jgi:hypothetical protein